MSPKTAVKPSAAPVVRQDEELAPLVAYIHDMLLELRRMAPPEAGAVLPYMVDMASVEAAEARDRLTHRGRSVASLRVGEDAPAER